MLNQWIQRRGRRKIAAALYDAVVAQARQPVFYADFGVPDTFDGRLEMMIAHLYLLNRRLMEAGGSGPALSQDVVDGFIADIEVAMREAGTGDQVVPKRLAKVTRIVHGRVGAFDRALASDAPHDELAATFARNLFGGRSVETTEQQLATWFEAARDHLTTSADDEMLADPARRFDEAMNDTMRTLAREHAA